MGPDILIVLIVILGIVLIARGPAMLPRIGEALGRTVKTAREEIPSAIKDDPTADLKTAGASDTTPTADPPDRPAVP